jgi:hypothetical protein
MRLLYNFITFTVITEKEICETRSFMYLNMYIVQNYIFSENRLICSMTGRMDTPYTQRQITCSSHKTMSLLINWKWLKKSRLENIRLMYSYDFRRSTRKNLRDGIGMHIWSLHVSRYLPVPLARQTPGHQRGVIPWRMCDVFTRIRAWTGDLHLAIECCKSDLSNSPTRVLENSSWHWIIV